VVDASVVVTVELLELELVLELALVLVVVLDVVVVLLDVVLLLVLVLLLELVLVDETVVAAVTVVDEVLVVVLEEVLVVVQSTQHGSVGCCWITGDGCRVAVASSVGGCTRYSNDTFAPAVSDPPMVIVLLAATSRRPRGSPPRPAQLSAAPFGIVTSQPLTSMRPAYPPNGEPGMASAFTRAAPVNTTGPSVCAAKMPPPPPARTSIVPCSAISPVA
jgi:hypothetical protein